MPRKGIEDPIERVRSVRKGTKRDEPGGEVITVEVRVNDKLEYFRAASITTQVGNSGNYRYTTDNGDEIIYRRSQGYKQLAKDMIEV